MPTPVPSVVSVVLQREQQERQRVIWGLPARSWTTVVLFDGHNLEDTAHSAESDGAGALTDAVGSSAWSVTDAAKGVNDANDGQEESDESERPSKASSKGRSKTGKPSVTKETSSLSTRESESNAGSLILCS